MPEPFTITISCKGKEIPFEITPVISVYTYRFLVTVNETDIVFERDEEGGFRAMKAEGHLHHEMKEADMALLTAIQQEIEKIFG